MITNEPTILTYDPTFDRHFDIYMEELSEVRNVEGLTREGIIERMFTSSFLGMDSEILKQFNKHVDVEAFQ